MKGFGKPTEKTPIKRFLEYTHFPGKIPENVCKPLSH